jgi:hypothetical protein
MFNVGITAGRLMTIRCRRNIRVAFAGSDKITERPKVALFLETRPVGAAVEITVSRARSFRTPVTSRGCDGRP